MFAIRKDRFYLDNEPFVIRSATLQYFRNMPDSWEEKLRKLKAAGLNTVETYICWNQIEPKKGHFDFSGRNDILSFLETVKRVGLYAIIRPGPYICAEIDGGGLPWWLLVDEDGNPVSPHIRSSSEPYLSAALAYFRKVLPMIAPYQSTHGGPILMMQVENEYGAFGNDHRYLQALIDEMRNDGIDVPLFTSDSIWKTNIAGTLMPDCLYTLNFGSDPTEKFAKLDALLPGQPHMNTEFWVGWFSSWGKKRPLRKTEDFANAFQYYVDTQDSFNLWVFCGGTNFGETAGANCAPLQDGGFMPTTTSYDYDALLTEWGGYTPKYHVVRNALLPKLGLDPATEPLPDEPKLQNIGAVSLTMSSDPFAHREVLGRPITANDPLTFEQLGLGTGLVLYSTRLTGAYEKYRIWLPEVHDFARLYLDGMCLGSISRNDSDNSVETVEISEAGASLDILVEAMGHVNYGENCLDRKGLIGGARYGGQNLFSWQMQPYAIADTTKLPFEDGLHKGKFGITALKGYFSASKRLGCFIHIDEGKKGFVFVNGENLGRYWNIGPQLDLYCPGSVLKEENEIIVLDIEGALPTQVTITDTREWKE